MLFGTNVGSMWGVQRFVFGHAPRRAVRLRQAILALVPALSVTLAAASSAAAETPVYLRDRGTGIPTSLVGTYVESHQLLVYPFYEYTINTDQEYKPAELGYGLEQDFRGQRVDHEILMLATYGFSERIAIEIESALWTTAKLRTAENDPSGIPPEMTESGLGDTQAELRWKWSKETLHRPEFFSYFEAVFPLQKDKVLIGTSEWELTQGLGAIKGFGWGTVTTRASVSYTSGDGQIVFGEYDLEYLKRTGPSWRWAVSLEGEQDELELIPEAQWHSAPGSVRQAEHRDRAHQQDAGPRARSRSGVHLPRALTHDVGAIDGRRAKRDIRGVKAPDSVIQSERRTFMGRLRNYLLTGLLALGPTALTLWVFFRLLNWVDHWLGDYLKYVGLSPRNVGLTGDRIPGLGLAATLLLLMLVGWVVSLLAAGSAAARCTPCGTTC